MKSKFMFLFLCFLVWPYNKHLINRARSVVWENLDRGQDSPIQTDLARLIRAKNIVFRIPTQFCQILPVLLGPDVLPHELTIFNAREPFSEKSSATII